MLAYILIKDGEVDVIPVEVDLRNFTHITIRNRRLDRSLLMKHLKYYSVRGNETAVFMLSQHDFENTDQPKE